jgi:CRP-like cAMP-binding protein
MSCLPKVPGSNELVYAANPFSAAYSARLRLFLIASERQVNSSSTAILGIDDRERLMCSRLTAQESTMDILAPSPNRLLASLVSSDLDLIKPHLRENELVHAAVLAVAGDELKQAYFPHSGIISLVVRLSMGETTEVAMVGRESLFGASAALGSPRALTTAMVQSPGMCSVIPIKRLQAATEESKTIRTVLTQHEQAIFLQTQQSAGCLASHAGIARLARWLLRARDAAGTDELHFTQDFLGQMLGVQRNAVSSVAGTLQDRGLITFSRAQIRILDASGMKAIACECYETVKNGLQHLKGGTLH